MVPFVKTISKKYNLKKPQKNEKNIFTLYSPKKAIIEKADTLSIDTEVLIKLPENSSDFVATKFEGKEILRIIGPTSTKKRLRITLLNESYLNKCQINKVDVIRHLIIEPDNNKTHYEEAKEKPSRQRHPNNYLPKDWLKRWKKYFQKKKNILSSDRRIMYDYEIGMTLTTLEGTL